MTSILYVCDRCHEDAPEGCGHDDRDNLRVAPEVEGQYDEETICHGCWEMWSERRADERPEWDALPLPPEFRPVTA